MKRLLVIILITHGLTSCNSSGGGSPTSTGSVAPTCDPFVLSTEMVAVQYTGTTVTTSGTCDNGGQEYIITTDADYNVAGSATGWRLINSVLTTNGGNVSFTTGGRFQTTDGVNEGHGLSFGGVDNTTCQTAHSINGTADNYEIQVTAEFDSSCVPRLRGTFREYSTCTDTSQVAICSGTITLER